MNRQIETASSEQNPSSWAKVKAWLQGLDIAMDYDAYSHANAKIECLKVELERLEIRVAALEKCREG
jgi:hypothetical protein